MQEPYKTDKTIVEGWKNILKQLRCIDTKSEGDTTIRKYKHPLRPTIFQWVFNAASGWNFIEVVVDNCNNEIQCAWKYKDIDK
jgi:hypothetical protein